VLQAAEDSLTSLPTYWDLGEAHWDDTYQYTFTADGYPIGCGQFNASGMVPLGGGEYRYPPLPHSCASRLGVGDPFVAITWLGFTYGIANSSRVTTRDVVIRASPYSAVLELDGPGGHVYRNVSVSPGPGRLISVNADGIHSEDVDVGPVPLTLTLARHPNK
jgi:hypothetical protein